MSAVGGYWAVWGREGGGAGPPSSHCCTFLAAPPGARCLLSAITSLPQPQPKCQPCSLNILHVRLTPPPQTHLLVLGPNRPYTPSITSCLPHNHSAHLAHFNTIQIPPPPPPPPPKHTHVCHMCNSTPPPFRGSPPYASHTFRSWVHASIHPLHHLLPAKSQVATRLGGALQTINLLILHWGGGCRGKL